MAILQREIILYGSAVMPDTDATTEIGGAIALTKKMGFADLSTPSLVEIVSSQAADITQTITISYRTTAGVLATEVKTLSGLTPVAFVATMERLLKAIKSATTAGDVAIMTSTAERTGTAQAGTADTITLDAGASAVDDFYTGMVIRLTSGTGANQIRSIIKYVGSTKVATISNTAWATTPDSTSVFRVARGMVFDKTPSEIFEVRRLFFDASANPPGGLTKTYYDKGFFKNTHGTLALTSAVVSEVSDPATIDFDLETVLDGTTTNGVGNNRQVAPSGFTFASTTKNVANSQNHTAAAAQGIWLQLTLVGGAAALNVVYQIKEQGNTT